MANVSDFVLVCSFVWTYVCVFAGITLAVLWGCYWWRKYCVYAAKKQERRVDDLKKLTEMELRVGFRRQ